jgi:RNase P subunit RPR2
MKHEPKPLIEEHWHIQQLIDAQERRVAERNSSRNKAKLLAMREEDIAMEPPAVIKEFWCSHCSKDFLHPTMKQVEKDWSNTNQNIAFYKTKHECGTWCIRHITDKLEDAYWTRSKKVATDRGKHSIDLLQPFENNYNLVWGKK